MKKRKLLLVVLSVLFSPALFASEGTPKKLGEQRWSTLNLAAAHCEGEKILPAGRNSSRGEGSSSGPARAARAQ